MEKIEELGESERVKINTEIVKKLPEKFEALTLDQIC